MADRADEPHPQAQAIVERVEEADAPRMWEVPPEEARELFEAGIRTMEDHLTYEEVGEVREADAPAPGGRIPLRAYLPPGAGDGASPIVVYLHGGGLVVGSHGTHDHVCRALSARAGCLVLSVEYRLAPEHPWPAPLEDAYAATRWAAERGPELGGDPDRLAVVGDSSGGNLAAAVALAALDRDGPDIAHQGLLCPHVAAPGIHWFESYEENAEGYLLERKLMEYYRDKWPRDDVHRRNEYLAPLLARDLSGLPRATVVTAGFDPLRDEGAAYAGRLDEAGVPIDHHHYPDQIHGFYSYLGIVEAADDVLDALAEDLEVALGPQGA